MKSTIYYFIILIFFSSCATSYRQVRPERFTYTNVNKTEELDFYYRYDVMERIGNKRIAKKERKKGLRIVAIQIKNNSEASLTFKDLKIMAGDREIIPADMTTVHKQLNQNVAPYILYSVISLNQTDPVTRQTTVVFPIGIFVGAYNMIMAGVANHSFKKEVINKDIRYIVVPPGETRHALMAIAILEPLALRAEVRK